MDLGLLKFIEEATARKPRRWLRPSTLLAFVEQESSGVPFFIDTRPGSLYKMNMLGAQRYTKEDPHDKRKKIVITTGLKEAQIVKLITIPKEINGWAVPPAMRGKLAKFRFEPGYWERYYREIEDPEKRFLYSCSWGLVQFMSPNIAKTHDQEGIDFIRRFAADIPLQLLYGAGMAEDLLEKASKPISAEQIERWKNGYTNSKGAWVPKLKPDILKACMSATQIERAYKGYNSGRIDSADPKVIARAQNVLRMAKDFEAQIQTLKR